jgi:hypothetical protein
MLTEARLVQPANELVPIFVTLLSFAKITEVTVTSSSIQDTGISPVFVEPTCPPEELKALDVVMGAVPPELATIAVLLPHTDEP